MSEPGAAAVSGDRDAGAQPSGRARLAPVLWGALLVAAVVVPLLRSSGTPTWSGLWAEDGTVYLADAVADGPVTPLLRGFSGYVQLPTRILAAPMAVLPVEWAAGYAAITGVVVTVGVAVLTAHLARAWITSPLMRAVLVAWMVLTPVAAIDMTANLVNLIWVYLAALPFALVSMEERRRDVGLRCLVVVAAATATIVSLVFLPLAVGWAAYRRTRATVTVAVVFGVAGVLQLVASRFTEDAIRIDPERSVVDLVRLVSGRAFAAPLLGTELARDAWDAQGRALLVGTTVLVLVILAAIGWGADRQAQVVGGLLAGYAVVLFTALALGRGTNVFRFQGGRLDVFEHPRYGYATSVLMLGAVATLASRRRPGATRSGQWARAAIVAHAVVVLLLSFDDVGYRAQTTRWRDQVERARAACEVADLDASEPAPVPQDVTGFFIVDLTCGDLRT